MKRLEVSHLADLAARSLERAEAALLDGDPDAGGFDDPGYAVFVAEMDSRVVGSAVGCALNGKPVLLKRGMTATIEEWLMASEYIAQRGNLDVVLCERGIRTFEASTRNTLDISAVPVVQAASHLPIIVDPSHASGPRTSWCRAPGPPWPSAPTG